MIMEIIVSHLEDNKKRQSTKSFINLKWCIFVSLELTFLFISVWKIVKVNGKMSTRCYWVIVIRYFPLITKYPYKTFMK